MKILITGDKSENGLAGAFARAFKELGCEPVIFAEADRYRQIFPRLKNRYTNRLFWKLFALPLQKEFLIAANKEKPDLILILKGWYLRPETILAVKKELLGAKVFCFNPDNPFNTWHFGASNDWMIKSVPLYDAYFIWGEFLIDGVRKAGAKKVECLPFGYDAKLHYPVLVSEQERKVYGSDVAFIGSWDEVREECLNYLLGYDLKIWGSAWHKANKNLRKKWQEKEAVAEEFSKVCNSAKIVLNIIRKQNEGAHNMRTFEVPACGGFLLSGRTEQAKSFFEEDKEMVYFSGPAELKEKIDFYLKNDSLRKKIAETSYQRLLNAGYSYTDRAKKILEFY